MRTQYMIGMGQPILKRRLNPFLLISTIAALALLTGVAVVAQDRIKENVDSAEEINQSNKELNNTIMDLRSEIEDKNTKIDSLKNRLENFQTRIKSMNTTVKQKNQEIQSLEEKLAEAENKSEIEAEIDKLNTSLGIMCSQIQPSEVDLNRCDDHGHQMEEPSDES